MAPVRREAFPGLAIAVLVVALTSARLNLKSIQPV
jgi:hypothetical protein